MTKNLLKTLKLFLNDKLVISFMFYSGFFLKKKKFLIKILYLQFYFTNFLKIQIFYQTVKNVRQNDSKIKTTQKSQKKQGTLDLI